MSSPQAASTPSAKAAPPAGLPATAWAVAGAALILALVVGVMAWMSAHRAKQAMSSLLLEKGEAIITAVEAGARTGLRGHRRGAPADDRLQILLEEMAAQPNVLFLALTDGRGRLQLHSGSPDVGGRLWDEADMASLAPGCAPQWRIVEAPDGRQAFLVYRTYSPLAPHCSPAMRAQLGALPPHHEPAWCGLNNATCPDPSTGHALFVGLEIAPFDAARREDLRNTALLSLALLVLGGGGVGSLFWARDARQSRLLLARSQTLAAEALTQMPAGCLVLDPSGRIDRCNATAEAMLGRPCACGMDSIEHLPPVLAEAIRPVLQDGAPVDQELLLPHAGADPQPVQLTASAMPPAQGLPAGVLVILRDLTETKRLQEAVRRRDKLSAVGSLAAGVAHEIRNPLGAIKAAATFFRGQFPDHSDGDRMASLMLREVDRLNRVVGELLELGRPSDATLQEVAIRDVMERCITLLKFDLDQQHIAINNTIQRDLPAILGDADKLLQALLNLMLNAMEAMHRVEDRPRVLTLTARTELAGPARAVVLEVRDTGPGVAEEVLPTLFTPYVTTRPQGVGLGLAVVQQIMEAHHGEVRLANAIPGPGAVATLRFFNIVKDNP